MSRTSLQQEPSGHQTLKAALSIAQQGIPVFPCKPAPDKSPLTGLGGFHKASTDPDRIRAWWTRYPGASIGVPTGARSGWWMLDVDRLEALEDLERKHGKLPVTLIVRTPSGGFHIYFQYVEGITNSPGGLPKGIDVRGKGGYVLAAPSEGYTVLDDSPVAPAPEWLLELVRVRPQSSGGSAGVGEPSAITANLDGPQIPFGTRNNTLTRIAGKLHDGSRPFDQLLIDLETVNQARCVPPLGNHPTDRPDEVARIAASIIRRSSCRQATPKVQPEMLDELGRIEQANLWGRQWKGRGLKVARSVFASLILAARQYGTLIPAGVRISLSERDLALRAGLSKRSVVAAIRALRLEEVLRRDSLDRHPEHSGAFVLVRPPSRAKYNHSTTGGVVGGGKKIGGSGYTLRAPRLRCSTPGSGKRLRGTVTGTSKVRQGPAPKERDPMIRLDKGAEEVLDWLGAVGGTLGLEELAEIVGTRLRDLRGDGRVVAKLEAAGVVVVEEDAVSLAPDWLARLDDDRERAGEFEAHERDKNRYQREREERWGCLEGLQREQQEPQEAIRSTDEVRELAREFFDLPAIESPEPAPLEEVPELSDDDVDALVAICEFEERFGRGSFEWNRAGAKKLFYQCNPSIWPESEQLMRLRDYVSTVGGLDVVREYLAVAGVIAA